MIQVMLQYMKLLKHAAPSLDSHDALWQTIQRVRISQFVVDLQLNSIIIIINYCE